MTIEELYIILKKELEYKLSGKLIIHGTYIKWEYDALGIDIEDELEDHLNIIHCDDLEIMKEFIDDEFYISESEIEGSFIFFYIEK